MKYRNLFISLTSIILIISNSSSATANKHVPTQTEIDAAKKAEQAKKVLAENSSKKLATAVLDLRKLSQIAAVANARYQSAVTALQVAKTNKLLADKAYEDSIKAVTETKNDIGRLALSAYQTGGSLSDLETLLDANGPQDLIDRLTTLDLVGSKNSTALDRFKAAQIIAQKMKLLAEQAKIRQEKATAIVAVAKKNANDAKNAQQTEVQRLTAIQNKLARDLASAKKVRITLEQKRQLALLEENRSQIADNTKVKTKVWKTGGPTGKSSIRTTVNQRLLAVEFAKRQVLAKKPYVWGAEGPNSFDCSGLVYAAYKYAGLGWPNWDRLNAALYYTYTKQLPVAEMQPGDLIFYSYNGSIAAIHHMSIYAGNGMMWEARSTKSGLRFSSINSVDGMMPFVGRV